MPAARDPDLYEPSAGASDFARVMAFAHAFVGRVQTLVVLVRLSLFARVEGRLCLHETHLGTVTDVEGDEVAVTYETDEGPMEQVYERSQFLDGQLPRVGDRLEAHVIVTRTVPDSSETSERVGEKEEERDDFPDFREKGVSGPIEI